MSWVAGSGDFCPDGEIEYDKKTRVSGWRERLRLYYLAQAPEEQRRLLDYGDNHVGYGASGYQSYVIKKFLYELGVHVCQYGSPEHPCNKPLNPIEPQEVPTSYTTGKSYQTLGSLIFGGPGMMVDEALKNIIERLEPGVHQFFPIEIRMPRGKVYPTQYYTFVIGQYLDSFSPESSDEWSFSANGPFKYRHKENREGVTGLAFFQAIFGKAHLWRERRFGEWLTCFSDELQAEIAGAGLRIPRRYRMKEV